MILIRNFDSVINLINSNDEKDIELFTGIVKTHELGVYHTDNYGFIRNERGEVMIKNNAGFYYNITISHELVNFLYYSYSIMRGNT